MHRRGGSCAEVPDAAGSGCATSILGSQRRVNVAAWRRGRAPAQGAAPAPAVVGERCGPYTGRPLLTEG
jgi:hypothetical protein